MNFDIKGILDQARKMQDDMLIAKEEIRKLSVEAETGGGMVKVTMSGDGKVQKIEISDELFAMNDKIMLQDLIRGAVNNATDKANELMAKEMKKLTPSLPNIPGLNLGI